MVVTFLASFAVEEGQPAWPLQARWHGVVVLVTVVPAVGFVADPVDTSDALRRSLLLYSGKVDFMGKKSLNKESINETLQAYYQITSTCPLKRPWSWLLIYLRSGC